jgi:hypothetical protein
MRRSLVARGILGLAVLVGAGGCAGPGSSGPAAAPTSQPSANPNDGDAPQFVAYRDFRDAAAQMSTQSPGAGSPGKRDRAGQHRTAAWLVVQQADGNPDAPADAGPGAATAPTTTDGS